MKILIIEDDVALSDMYKDKFELKGFAVSTAFDGEKGLRAALKERPDLVLLDIKMPKMDGMTVMKKLRQDLWGKGVPIIILTNLDTTNKTLEGITQDAPAYYLLKDKVTPEEVLEKVQEVLKIDSRNPRV